MNKDNKVSDEIEASVEKGIILNGKIQYDGYNKKNCVYSFDKTEVKIF